MNLQELKEALEIFSKYKDLSDEEFAAEHDVVYLFESEDVSKEDKNRLEELGFFFDEEFECWSCFT